MSRNLGAYLGIAKESTFGTPVAATAFLALTQPADIHAERNLQDIANTTAFGPLATTPGIRHGALNASVAADPAGLGYLLAALFGAPTTTGASAPYSHAFTPLTTQDPWTFEGKDGIDVHQLAGGKLTQIQLSHSPDGYLMATIDGLGQDKIEGASASTPSLPTQFFSQRELVVTIDGTDVSSLVESVQVTLNLPKEALPGFGVQVVQGVEPTGEADATINITLRADGVDRFTGFKAASDIVVDLAWTISANYSLDLNFPHAVLTGDPTLRSNTDLGTARIALPYRALAQGTDLVTATVVNSVTSY